MNETSTMIEQFALYNGQLVKVVGFFAHAEGNAVFISYEDGAEEEVPFSALDLL